MIRVPLGGRNHGDAVKNHPAPRNDKGWGRRNRTVLLGLVLLLIGAGGFGLLLGQQPALASGLSSVAMPYNWFHLAAGFAGLVVWLSRREAVAQAFNLGFGLIDLYQAVAGVCGWAPAQLFELRPGDHVIHLVLGLALVLVAWQARNQARAAGQPA